jgi:hypothetical protein
VISNTGEELLQHGRLYAWHLALTLTAENVVPIVLDWMRLAPVDTGHLSFRALGAYRTKPARIGWSLRLDVLWWAEFRRKIVGPRGTIAGSDREFKKQALVMALDRNHVWAGRANAMEAGCGVMQLSGSTSWRGGPCANAGPLGIPQPWWNHPEAVSSLCRACLDIGLALCLYFLNILYCRNWMSSFFCRYQ